MSSPINFEHYRVTSKWNEDDFKNRANQLLTNQIHVLSDAEKKSLAKVLSDHTFMPLSVPKFKETLKGLSADAARDLLNMYLNYYMEYFQYKQVARGLIAKLKPSTKKSATKKSATKKSATKKPKRAKSKSKK